ncbi:MAG TPA: cyclic nucleotide-binding domain-containing protein, partial [Thermoanaerobaculia bacterium]|nr:cyclic nucleotide-binding domain-containing protein [Thermoanaerobaculia bacterium]
DIRKAVWYALRRNGISIPFPIRAYQPYKPPVHEDRQIPPDELRARLMEVDILSPLSADAHEAIAAAVKVHFFSKGETIIRHGTAGESMFVVHEGIVSVRIPDDSSVGWHEVARLVAGSVFGEMALLTGETRTADIAATTDVMAIEITKDALQPILQSHPELAAALSAKVMERQDRLDEIRADATEDEERSVLSRIRAYFGL